MTLIAQLDHEQDPAVVVTLYDYGNDHVPGHYKPPEYMDVTDEDPRPEPGYTYDGETFSPGVPQAQEEARQEGRDELSAALEVNDVYLALDKPTQTQQFAQIRALTEQANLLIRGTLQEYE
jgi:hypothetical protein